MTEQLICILKSELRQTPAVLPPDTDWEKLGELAERQKLLPFVADFISRLPEKDRPAGSAAADLKTRQALALSCRGYQARAIGDICAALDEADIDYLLFKGAVTRFRYPREDLRTMSDIDLLYKPQDHERFRKAMEGAGFTDHEAGRKNDTYRRLPFVCVEAHRELVPAGSRFSGYCGGVWRRAKKCTDGARYEMTAEDEYIFCLIHLAGHFLKGGAGVRFFVDVYFYENTPMDRGYLTSELKKIGLYDFYRTAAALCDMWFGDGAGDDRLRKIAAFVLSGGLFGTKGRASDLAVEGGKMRFALRACFPSYEEMCSMYPWLTGKKILLPVSWAHRGVTGIFRRRGNVRRQMRRLSEGDAESGRRLREFLADCGLKEEKEK